MQIKRYVYILLVFLLLGTGQFLLLGYRVSHRHDAGELVYNSCGGGGYVPVKRFGSGVINPGGPCIGTGAAYVLKNNYSDYYISIAAFGTSVLAGSLFLYRDLKSQHKL